MSIRRLVVLTLATASLYGGPVAAAPGETPDVLIVGAGLAGMSAAYYCKQAGLSYHVLELTPHLGGRMRSAKYPQGVAAEAGLMEFWEGNPALDIAHDLKLPTDRGDTSFSSFYFQGKLIPFTQDTNEQFVAALLSPAERKAYLAWDKKMDAYHKQIDAFVFQGKPFSAEMLKLKDVSFGDWVKKTSGLGAKGIALVQGCTEPEFATGWDRISALDGIHEWHIFSGKGTGNQHIQGGNQRLAEALVDHVGREHVEVNRQVTNVRHDANGVEVTAMDPADYKFHTYKAKHLVTTMPLFRLYEVQFSPALPAKVYEAVDTQTWGAYFTAHVIADRAAQKYWTMNGDSILPILAPGPVGVLYEGEDDGKGDVLINVLVTGDSAEAYNARTGSVDMVRKTLLAEIDKLWPGFSKHVKQTTFVRYHPRAIASWPVGRSRYDALSQFVRQPHGRIHLAGDFTEGTHSDGAVYSAQRVVRQIAQAEGKKWAGPAKAAAPAH